MRILQINTVVNTGSTGRITEDIGKQLISEGHTSHIAFGRNERHSQSELIKIGTKADVLWHGLYTRLADRHGFASKKSTVELTQEIDRIKPDAIGLHNLHGYYLNIEVLFNYLKKRQIPLVWTLFDCWSFTGHCAYFTKVGCEKWKTHCKECPQTQSYPKSFYWDNSFRNFSDKQKIFTGHPNTTIVTHSQWLKDLVGKSFLKEYPVKVIPSGIDVSQFRVIKESMNELKLTKGKKVLLGVASIWEERKGLDDFIELYDLLAEEYQIVLIGVTKKQKRQLPSGILGITRTENIQKLTEWYNRADVFLNPTYEDNFPTTNLEALACGTPVITYDTGGSPEAIDSNTGMVVPCGDIKALKKAAEHLSVNKPEMTSACRRRAEELYDCKDRYEEYINLYKSVTYNR
ncbi:MAG: glycosyltransferase [Balneolaceae bacterium]|nr:glycosyltransferase [Balneolaceae bacterium]